MESYLIIWIFDYFSTYFMNIIYFDIIIKGILFFYIKFDQNNAADGIYHFRTKYLYKDIGSYDVWFSLGLLLIVTCTTTVQRFSCEIY